VGRAKKAKIFISISIERFIKSTREVFFAKLCHVNEKSKYIKEIKNLSRWNAFEAHLNVKKAQMLFNNLNLLRGKGFSIKSTEHGK
jgi:hypothetical protein